MIGAAVALVLAVSPSAVASSPGPPLPRLTYTCTLAVTDLGATIRVVYRLRTDAPGWRWRVRLWDRKRLVYSNFTRTDATGRAIVRVRIRDLKGPDALRARARNLSTDRVCAVALKA